MPWPKTNKFGVVDNPIVFSPYSADNDEGESFPYPNVFLFLNGQDFGLLSPGLFLLL